MDSETEEVIEVMRGATRARLDPDAELIELLPQLVGEPTEAAIRAVLERLVQNENSHRR